MDDSEDPFSEFYSKGPFSELSPTELYPTKADMYVDSDLVYEGDTKQDGTGRKIPNGRGTLKRIALDEATGERVDTVLYKGKWKDGKKDGEGIEFSDDLVLKGFWKDGLRHGPFLIKVPGEQKPKYAAWKDGVLASEVVTNYEPFAKRGKIVNICNSNTYTGPQQRLVQALCDDKYNDKWYENAKPSANRYAAYAEKLQKQLTENQKALIDSEDKLTVTEEAFAGCEKKLAATEEALRQSNNMISQQENDLIETNKKIIALNIQLQQLQNINLQLEKQRKNNEKQKSQQESLIQDLKGQFQNQEQKISNLKQRHIQETQTLQKKIEILNTTQTVDEKIRQLTDSYEQQVADLSAQISELRTKQASHELEKQEMSKQNQDLLRDQGSLRDIILGFEKNVNDVETKTRELESVKQNLLKAKELIGQMQSVGDRTDQINALGDENQKLKDIAMKQQALLVAAKSQLEKLESDKDSPQLQDESSLRQVQELKQEAQ